MTKTTLQEHERNIEPLDALRGLAAFLVVMGHARGITLIALHEPSTGVGWQKVVFLPTSYAREAVALFFVLSGYLVGGQVLRSLRSGRFSWRGYMARRFSRLYAVLVPALVATTLIDLYIRHFLGSSARAVGDTPFRVSELACNLAFLQPARCDPYGSNGPLWSLGYEFWFYVVFAAASVAIFSAIRGARRMAVLNGAVAVAGVLVFGVQLLWLFPAWLMGVALAEWQRGRQPGRAPLRAVVCSIVLLGSLATLSTVTGMPLTISFFILGLATLPLIQVLTSSSTVWGTWPVKQLARLGGWSYTLYAFHRPLVSLAAAALAHSGTTLLGVTSVVVIYSMAVAFAVLCYPAYFAGEAHTLRIRRALLPKTSATPTPVAPAPSA